MLEGHGDAPEHRGKSMEALIKPSWCVFMAPIYEMISSLVFSGFELVIGSLPCRSPGHGVPPCENGRRKASQRTSTSRVLVKIGGSASLAAGGDPINAKLANIIIRIPNGTVTFGERRKARLWSCPMMTP